VICDPFLIFFLFLMMPTLRVVKVGEET